MIFALVGAHRVGKTTLASAFADATGAKFLPMSLSAVQKEIGFDSSNQSYSFDERMKVQEYLIERMDEIYEKHYGEDVIADRSPIDLIAYAMVHVGEHTTDEQSKRLERFIERCIEVAETHCVGCLLVQPGIQLVESETSAKCSKGFIEHLNSLCFGLINDERLINVPMYYMPRATLLLDERVNVVKNAVARATARNKSRHFPAPKAKEGHFVATQVIQ